MKHIKRFSEDIKIPIEVGDTILGGKFKNRKLVVKKIGKNKKGDITVNDKPLLKYRIVKESITQEDIDNGLAYLIDRLKGESLFAHVKLEKGERSELANLANDLL